MIGLYAARGHMQEVEGIDHVLLLAHKAGGERLAGPLLEEGPALGKLIFADASGAAGRIELVSRALVVYERGAAQAEDDFWSPTWATLPSMSMFRMLAMLQFAQMYCPFRVQSIRILAHCSWPPVMLRLVAQHTHM